MCFSVTSPAQSAPFGHVEVASPVAEWGTCVRCCGAIRQDVNPHEPPKSHINLVEEATQILPLRWGVVLRQREWHSPEHQVAVQRCDLVPADVGVVLGKAQRVDFDHVSTPAKLGRDVLREHLRVTSRHIDADVALAQQAVEKPIETHLDVWIAHLVPRDGELDLVEQDVVRFSWVNNLSFDVPRKVAHVTQVLVVVIVERHLDNVVVGNAALSLGTCGTAGRQGSSCRNA